eukprot:TRINITY_DN16793_c0_g1_i1.p1 TRINITY_DN16793_c0_g1~~TRINITY_DN16793_c0_g1_i1.p1  ORF type:complete len:1817 (+),score=466.02 TRINITY_DN16793_c0_g1_i1:96-5546(+)
MTTRPSLGLSLRLGSSGRSTTWGRGGGGGGGQAATDAEEEGEEATGSYLEHAEENLKLLGAQLNSISSSSRLAKRLSERFSRHFADEDNGCRLPAEDEVRSARSASRSLPPEGKALQTRPRPTASGASRDEAAAEAHATISLEDGSMLTPQRYASYRAAAFAGRHRASTPSSSPPPLLSRAAWTGGQHPRQWWSPETDEDNAGRRAADRGDGDKPTRSFSSSISRRLDRQPPEADERRSSRMASPEPTPGHLSGSLEETTEQLNVQARTILGMGRRLKELEKQMEDFAEGDPKARRSGKSQHDTLLSTQHEMVEGLVEKCLEHHSAEWAARLDEISQRLRTFDSSRLHPRSFGAELRGQPGNAGRHAQAAAKDEEEMSVRLASMEAACSEASAELSGCRRAEASMKEELELHSNKLQTVVASVSSLFDKDRLRTEALEDLSSQVTALSAELVDKAGRDDLERLGKQQLSRDSVEQMCQKQLNAQLPALRQELRALRDSVSGSADELAELREEGLRQLEAIDVRDDHRALSELADTLRQEMRQLVHDASRSLTEEVAGLEASWEWRFERLEGLEDAAEAPPPPQSALPNERSARQEGEEAASLSTRLERRLRKVAGLPGATAAVDQPGAARSSRKDLDSVALTQRHELDAMGCRLAEVEQRTEELQDLQASLDEQLAAEVRRHLEEVQATIGSEVDTRVADIRAQLEEKMQALLQSAEEEARQQRHLLEAAAHVRSTAAEEEQQRQQERCQDHAGIQSLVRSTVSDELLERSLTAQTFQEMQARIGTQFKAILLRENTLESRLQRMEAALRQQLLAMQMGPLAQTPRDKALKSAANSPGISPRYIAAVASAPGISPRYQPDPGKAFAYSPAVSPRQPTNIHTTPHEARGVAAVPVPVEVVSSPPPRQAPQLPASSRQQLPSPHHTLLPATCSETRPRQETAPSSPTTIYQDSRPAPECFDDIANDISSCGDDADKDSEGLASTVKGHLDSRELSDVTLGPLDTAPTGAAGAARQGQTRTAATAKPAVPSLRLREVFADEAPTAFSKANSSQPPPPPAKADSPPPADEETTLSHRPRLGLLPESPIVVSVTRSSSRALRADSPSSDGTILQLASPREIPRATSIDTEQTASPPATDLWPLVERSAPSVFLGGGSGEDTRPAHPSSSSAEAPAQSARGSVTSWHSDDCVGAEQPRRRAPSSASTPRPRAMEVAEALSGQEDEEQLPEASADCAADAAQPTSGDVSLAPAFPDEDGIRGSSTERYEETLTPRLQAGCAESVTAGSDTSETSLGAAAAVCERQVTADFGAAAQSGPAQSFAHGTEADSLTASPSSQSQAASTPRGQSAPEPRGGSERFGFQKTEHYQLSPEPEDDLQRDHEVASLSSGEEREDRVQWVMDLGPSAQAQPPSAASSSGSTEHVKPRAAYVVEQPVVASSRPNSRPGSAGSAGRAPALERKGHEVLPGTRMGSSSAIDALSHSEPSQAERGETPRAIESLQGGSSSARSSDLSERPTPRSQQPETARQPTTQQAAQSDDDDAVLSSPRSEASSSSASSSAAAANPAAATEAPPAGGAGSDDMEQMPEEVDNAGGAATSQEDALRISRENERRRHPRDNLEAEAFYGGAGAHSRSVSFDRNDEEHSRQVSATSAGGSELEHPQHSAVLTDYRGAAPDGIRQEAPPARGGVDETKAINRDSSGSSAGPSSPSSPGPVCPSRRGRHQQADAAAAGGRSPPSMDLWDDLLGDLEEAAEDNAAAASSGRSPQPAAARPAAAAFAGMGLAELLAKTSRKDAPAAAASRQDVSSDSDSSSGFGDDVPLPD